MPPTSPPVAAGDSEVPYLGDEDGDEDITTAEIGIVESKLREDTIAVREL
jgi:hypothetical protein